MIKTIVIPRSDFANVTAMLALHVCGKIVSHFPRNLLNTHNIPFILWRPYNFRAARILYNVPANVRSVYSRFALGLLCDGLPIFHSFPPPLKFVACPECLLQRVPPELFRRYTWVMAMTMRDAAIAKFKKIASIFTTATRIFHFVFLLRRPTNSKNRQAFAQRLPYADVPASGMCVANSMGCCAK